jgi:hypothetical protein
MLAHWTRRHRVLAAGLLAVFGMVTASVIALAWLYRASSINAAVARDNAKSQKRA